MVESIEVVGDEYYLFCSVEGGYKVIIKTTKRREIGEDVDFKINRYNLFKDGVSSQRMSSTEQAVMP